MRARAGARESTRAGARGSSRSPRVNQPRVTDGRRCAVCAGGGGVANWCFRRSAADHLRYDYLRVAAHRRDGSPVRVRLCRRVQGGGVVLETPLPERVDDCCRRGRADVAGASFRSKTESAVLHRSDLGKWRRPRLVAPRLPRQARTYRSASPTQHPPRSPVCAAVTALYVALCVQDRNFLPSNFLPAGMSRSFRIRLQDERVRGASGSVCKAPPRWRRARSQLPCARAGLPPRGRAARGGPWIRPTAQFPGRRNADRRWSNWPPRPRATAASTFP